MPKQLKFYNGRLTTDDNFRGYIAAYTKKQAVELGKRAFGLFSTKELTDYWSDCWGNAMDGIVPTGPGVWIANRIDKTVWQFVEKQNNPSMLNPSVLNAVIELYKNLGSEPWFVSIGIGEDDVLYLYVENLKHQKLRELQTAGYMGYRVEIVKCGSIKPIT